MKLLSINRLLQDHHSTEKEFLLYHYFFFIYMPKACMWFALMPFRTLNLFLNVFCQVHKKYEKHREYFAKDWDKPPISNKLIKIMHSFFSCFTDIIEHFEYFTEIIEHFEDCWNWSCRFFCTVEKEMCHVRGDNHEASLCNCDDGNTTFYCAEELSWYFSVFFLEFSCGKWTSDVLKWTRIYQIRNARVITRRNVLLKSTTVDCM